MQPMGRMDWIRVACTIALFARRRLASLLLAAGLAMLLACGADIESRLGEIRGLHAANQFAASVRPLRQILADAPEHPEANYLLGVAFLRTGRATLALWPLRLASRSKTSGREAGRLLGSALLLTRNFEEAVAAKRGTILDTVSKSSRSAALVSSALVIRLLRAS